MSRLLAAALVTAAFSLWTASASALDCSHRLVEVGDPAHYVRSICGEPASVAHRTETRTQARTIGAGRAGVVDAISVTVEIEVWLYDFGPRRFMEELTFEGGVLRSIRTLGYGTRAGSERRTAVDRERPRGERVAILERRRALG